MKRLLVAIFSIALAFGLAGCWTGAPLGKGKAPVVYTKGWLRSCPGPGGLRWIWPWHKEPLHSRPSSSCPYWWASSGRLIRSV